MRGLFGSVVVVALALTLRACATTPAIIITCVPVKAYTAAQEKALAAAVRALQPDSPLVGAMADYGALRAAARACRHDP